MNGVLEWPGHKWIQRRERNLTFHLWHHRRRPERLSLNMELMFVPAGIDEEDEEAAYRDLYLEVHASMPRTGDWRDLIGSRLAGDVRKIHGEAGIIDLGEESPEIQLWSHGNGEASIHTHAQDFWNVSVEFGQPESGDGFELPIAVEAFQPSERARAARLDWLNDQVRTAFGTPEPFKPERDELLKEGWWLRYGGTVEFSRVFCSVPVNAPDPIAWAKAMAKRELNLTEFGRCRVNASRTMDEQFQPGDGVNESGRLVILNPLTAYWKDWQARKKG